MRSSAPWSVMCLLFLACDEPGLDRCLAQGAVQLVSSDNPRFHIDLSGGHTYVSFDGNWVSDLDHVLYVGEACGADARLIDLGITMSPVRLHPDDPDAEDPRLMCERSDAEFFRIDVRGDDPPELLLPRFNCHTLVVTPHGPVIGERHRNVLWHVPNFPDDAGAVELRGEASIRSAVWLNDRLLYATADGIYRRDLATGADELLVPGANKFWHTDTHLLWRGGFMADGESAPMYVRDLATGTDHYVGPYLLAEDEQDWDDPGPGWRFDADGAHILHLPNTPDSLMSAYDLTGAPVPFAGAGVRLAYPPVGGVVVQDGATLRHAVAGSATGTVLDLPANAILDDIQAIGDHLEVRVGSYLHAVPLDGGPAALLLTGVGAVRTRIDDELLLSITGHDLTLFHQPSNAQWHLAHHVEQFEYHPGHGVYYSRVDEPGALDNGVWMVSEDALRAAFAD